jgi:hypothetical protein
MRKLRHWTLAAALGLGLSVAARADDQDVPPPEPAKPFIRWSPYAKRMLGIEDARPGEDSKPQPKKRPAEAKPTTTAKQPAPVDASTQRALEETALLRRLAVCDKLLRIAVETNDQGLMRRAEELDARARAIYAQHTGMRADGKASADELTLDRHLASEAALKRPAQETMYAVSSRDSGRHPTVGEGSQ